MAVASPERYLADLNPAQREAVLATEGPLLVVAGAGSGKTRVLTYRVAHLLHAIGVKPNEILAITFTNKAAGEMRERLEDLLGPVARAIWILTFHAACGRILRREAPRLGYRSNFTIYDQADQVRLTKACLEELERDPKRFVPRGIHAQISAAKNQLVTPAEYAQRVASFYDQTVAEVYDLYQRRMFASNAVDFDDMLMLTVQVLERFPEALERWQKAFRYVLVDEYQDTNHAQYRLLKLLAQKHRNVCAVGDPDQCLVAGTLVTMGDGTRKTIEKVRVGDDVLSCHGSGRFAPSRVTRVHRGSRRNGIAITTASGRRIVSTPEHTHFAGFKPGATPQLHMTYLMWKAGSGFRIGTSTTYADGRGRPLPGPAIRLNGEHADACWVVSVHDDEARARAAETLLSLRYRLPTIPFVARPYRGSEGRSLVASQRLLDGVFQELDTETGGRDLLRDQGLSFDHPHFTSATTTSGARLRRRLTVCLCADKRNAGPQHRLSLSGYDRDGGNALREAGFSIRPAYKGAEGWRFETSYADFARLVEKVEDIEEVLDVSVRFTARLAAQGGSTKDRNALPFMPASAVRPGMVMVDENGAFDVVESVEHVVLDRPVYDLDVERTHNFVANGLVTHNSIYAFRGADIRNILEFERDFGETQDDRARAELPLDEHDPRVGERGHLAQPRAQAEEPLVRARRGRARARARGRGRARRGALRRRRDRRARRGGLQRQRDRGLLPDERTVAGARGRARPAGDRLPGDRRPALLRAGRDQGRDRLPPGDRQPVRRGLAAADREPAAPRDRRREPRAPPGARGRVRDLALGGVRPGRGGRDRRRAAPRGPAVPHACCSRCSPGRSSWRSPS